MKKILSLVLFVGLFLSGCSAQSAKELEWNSLSILSPKGAPAVALTPLVENGVDKIDFVDGADLLSAELVKGEYDAIVAPVNLGAMLYSKGNEAYKLYGVLTWGNLYIVGTLVQASDQPWKLAAFGDKAVPGIIYNKLFGNSSEYSADFFNSVSDVQAQLLSGQYTVGLLAEPLVTATLAKAESSNVALQVYDDVQAIWKEQTGFDNYPQAALFVKADLSDEALAQVAARFESMQTFISNADADASTVIEPINTVGADVLGVPSGELVSQAWEGLNIEVKSAADSKDAVEAFLELFKLNGLDFYH